MEDFDKSQPSVFEDFFDVTSLYAGTMQQPLPFGNYKWRNDLTIDDILNADFFGGVGSIVEIDLEYPPHLHDHHNDLPLAPAKLPIKTEWLSDHAKSFRIPASRVAKLVEILFDKNFYICHFKNLKFYVGKGLTVKRLHRVVQFDQSCWFGIYISMENLRKSRQTKFLSTEPEAKTCTLKPTFLNFQIIHESLVSGNLTQSSVCWKKPRPVGAAILDSSKFVPYKFHYNEVKPKFRDRLKVVYKDTNFLFYRIETDDLYSDMESFQHLLDFSDYPQNLKLFVSTNKKIPLTMKDKMKGQIMLEATCLRSKLYSINYESGIQQSAKGVQKCLKKTLHYDLFNDVWSSRGNIRKNVNQIQSQQHQLLVIQINKTVVFAFDDKRFILEDGIQSFPRVIISSSKQVLFVMFFWVPLKFRLNIMDSYLLILLRWPTCTQWAKKNHGSSWRWWWMWNPLHNFFISFTESSPSRNCLCSLLLMTFIYCKLLYALKHFSICIYLSVPSIFFLLFSQVPLIPV